MVILIMVPKLESRNPMCPCSQILRGIMLVDFFWTDIWASLLLRLLLRRFVISSG